MTERRLEWRPLDSLKPNPDNAKRHDLDGIGSSMARFGMVEPIHLDDRTGFIVSGHGRVDTLRARRDAGEAAPEGVEARGEIWLVPVITGWASRDDDEAAAATVAFNRWTEKGGWDVTALIGQLELLGQTPAGLEGVGMGREEIDDLLAAEQERARIPDDPDWLGDPERQVRALMFDYPLEQYRWMATTCARARKAYQVDSNAALLLAMLEEDAAR